MLSHTSATVWTVQCDMDVKHSKPGGHDGMNTGIKTARLVHTAKQRVIVLQTRQLHEYLTGVSRTRLTLFLCILEFIKLGYSQIHKDNNSY